MFKKGRRNEISFDEAIADSESSRAQIERSINPVIFYALALMVVGLGLLGLVRVSQLSLVNNLSYVKKAEANVNKEIPLVAPRGIIVDRYGDPLVQNKLVPSVFLRINDMVRNGEQEGVLNAFKDILGIDKETIIAELDKANLENANTVTIAQDVTREEDIKLSSLNFSSILIQNDYKRDYSGQAFSHVVGYVSLPNQADVKNDSSLNLVDAVGRSGLEAYYNDYLSGKDGSRTVYKKAPDGPDGSAAIIQEPKIGGTLQTTIDGELQRYFYDRLAYGAKLHGGAGALGIALNPQTGEILSLVSYPGYDANNIGKYLNDSKHPLFNRAISGLYNPASTIKPLDGVAGLHEGVINPSLQVFSRGYIEVPNPYKPEEPSRFADWRPNGWINLYSALAKSSNVYFYAVGGGLAPNEESRILRGATGIDGLGVDKLNEYWRLFGLGSKTGIDLPGETDSFLPNPEEKQTRTGVPWRLGDTYNVSIGQGDLAVNMLQLADYIASIANKGKIYEPHLKMSDHPKVIYDLSQFAPEFKQVQIGMEDSIYKSYGTSNSMADIPFKIAAKTGTAQTDLNTRINALCVAFGPTDDKNGPQIEFLVLIERAEEGSLNAIPVVRDVMKWYYEHRLVVGD